LTLKVKGGSDDLKNVLAFIFGVKSCGFFASFFHGSARNYFGNIFRKSGNKRRGSCDSAKVIGIFENISKAHFADLLSSGGRHFVPIDFSVFAFFRKRNFLSVKFVSIGVKIAIIAIVLLGFEVAVTNIRLLGSDEANGFAVAVNHFFVKGRKEDFIEPFHFYVLLCFVYSAFSGL
jgi:hypothetical protein